MSKRAESRQLALPPDLVKCLLLTWPVRQFREEPRLPANPPQAEDWWWTYELEYGLDRQNVGRLKERRQLLTGTLRVIADEGRDVQAIIAALEKIKNDILQDAIEGFQIDSTRLLTQDAVQIRKQLIKGLTRVVTFYRRLNADAAAEKRLRMRDASVAARVSPISPTRRRMALYAKVLRSVQRDPILTAYANIASTSRQRRKSAGNPQSRLLKQAKIVLQDAGVPQVLRIDLLRAIGLLPFRHEGQ